MRHLKAGKRLNRNTSHRKALRANMTCSLIQYGRITTTLEKAKAVAPFAEKMITLGRRGTLHARRQAIAVLRDKDAVRTLFDRVAPAMHDRPGGYTRIIKLAEKRLGDGGSKVIFELVDGKPPEEEE